MTSTYRLHYASADRPGDDSPWSVYVEEYATPDAEEPIADSTRKVSTHSTEAEAYAEAARLQRGEVMSEKKGPRVGVVKASELGDNWTAEHHLDRLDNERSETSTERADMNTFHYSIHVTSAADEDEVTQIIRNAVKAVAEDVPDEPQTEWAVEAFLEPSGLEIESYRGEAADEEDPIAGLQALSDREAEAHNIYTGLIEDQRLIRKYNDDEEV